MPPPRAPSATGWLARQLVTAELDLKEAERQLEAFLSYLFVRWNGWAFSHEAGIVSLDVYDVEESSDAVLRLHAAGFAVVTLHGHEAGPTVRCICSKRLAAD